MIQLIVGEKGKGKTKILLDMVNEAANTKNGNVSFLDKDLSHMYEIKNSVRFVNVSEYDVTSKDEFAGFISGVISADHDLEELYIDRILKLARLDSISESAELLRKLDTLSTKFSVRIIISLSGSKDDVPEDLKDRIITAL